MKMDFETTLEKVNTVLMYTGFRLFIGIPTVPRDEWKRGDVKVGIKWYGFDDIIQDMKELIK